MIGFLWFLAYTLGYVAIGSVVFLWVYTRPFFEVMRKSGYESEIPCMACAIVGSVFWPLGAPIWACVFGLRRLINVGNAIIRKRKEKEEQAEKDRELANRSW